MTQTKKRVSAHAAGLASAVIIVWIVQTFAKVTVPAEIAAAAGSLLSIIISLVLPDSMEVDE